MSSEDGSIYIFGTRVSKKLAALAAGIGVCEYMRQTGQTIDEIMPVVYLVTSYLGGQSIVDAVKAWKGSK